MHEPGFGRMMAASADGNLTNEEIARLYGKDENRFVLYPSDF